MAVFVVEGDLLKSDCTFIGHCSNCKMGFGRGIAGQIRTQIPEMYRAFKEDNRTPEDKLGSFSFAKTKFGFGFNLYGQFDYTGLGKGAVYVRYPALESAIDRMLAYVPQLANNPKIKQIKVGLPFLIGSNLAGGDWDTVYRIIEKMSDKHKIDIYLYRYNP